ncbi:TrbG/VirB9 family P-type conjugative transfer protein [Phenylobacterium sp. LjRoot225]|uniref:TrbG/VirB9 family P-type conjugative transfer protein n=1 Tax=Phenylobacterium sp. LjRoot225 TaxID=3342285 RepID=UPI003ECFE6F9
MSLFPPLRTLSLATAALVLTANTAQADGRMRRIAYDPDAVVRLEGCFGFQTMVQFGPDEHIENVGLGEASQWLVSPNKRANMLFVKPAYRTSHSNMTVATDRRVYAFELVARDTPACRRGAVAYSLRFAYPRDPAPAPALGSPADLPQAPAEPAVPPPDQRNATYSFTGARDNVPVRVFDNGRATFFRWTEGMSTPAVYALAADKTETPVSFTGKGDYLVVDQVAPAFVLRRGNAVAVLYNDAYQTPALDAGSPQPRPDAVAQTERRSPFGRGSKSR